MGNRAVINMIDSDVAIYLHWNGGLDTVYPVLQVAKRYGLSGDDVGMNDLFIIFHSMLSSAQAETAYVGTVEEYDGSAIGDNGTYIIDKDFNIVDRLDFEQREEQQVHSFDEVFDRAKIFAERIVWTYNRHKNLVAELKTALLLLEDQQPNKWSPEGMNQILSSVVFACNQYIQD
jgi:hypothetical protein